MKLYHYRPVKRVLQEIEYGTFYFSGMDELNDPIEGAVFTYWQGDKAAWEGLLGNYVCSLYRAITLYLLAAGHKELQRNTVLEDIHMFRELPMEQILERLRQGFWQEPEVQAVAAAYGNSRRKISKSELKIALSFLHMQAMKLCVEDFLRRQTIQKEAGQELLATIQKYIERMNFPAGLTQEIENGTADLRQVEMIMRVASKASKDLWELAVMQYGEELLYAEEGDETQEPAPENQRRKWMDIEINYPELYVERLVDMMYPHTYVVCFSENGDNSVMWGNYADNHKGACLIYETDEENKLSIGWPSGRTRLEARSVQYGAERVERNFFETLGRLPRKTVESWLSGVNEKSQCCEAFAQEERWREAYWQALMDKTYRKMDAWAYEAERRIHIVDSFYDFRSPDSRKLKYEPSALKGVIFGIKTTENDKKKIVDALRKKGVKAGNFTFQQAEYDEVNQKIEIYNKIGWNKLLEP